MADKRTEADRRSLRGFSRGRGVVATLAVVVTLTATLPGCSVPVVSTSPFRIETVVSGLDTPWDLAWGPDDAIWITERPGRVSRIDPVTGALTLIGLVEVHEQSESGLMGMAFHPDFAEQPYVYLAPLLQ